MQSTLDGPKVYALMTLDPFGYPALAARDIKTLAEANDLAQTLRLEQRREVQITEQCEVRSKPMGAPDGCGLAELYDPDTREWVLVMMANAVAERGMR